MGFLKFILILDLIGLVLAGLYALSMMGKRRPKNGFGRLGDYDYAHRGLHALPAGIPENSLRAFRLAANNGYGAELDVHLSRDGRLVIMHEPQAHHRRQRQYPRGHDSGSEPACPGGYAGEGPLSGGGPAPVQRQGAAADRDLNGQ